MREGAAPTGSDDTMSTIDKGGVSYSASSGVGSTLGVKSTRCDTLEFLNERF